ncbi:hypothetical protein [Cellulomonas phragmiteti]|uniref:Uncharacterized protein n=1 Tax=Cellulomonas phragmiteti TaxID=478780 RepID=A0ABQ4DHD5_9CELL|nr:hypothetical protein [Cellulomonas phragmiteti]GIG38763.1 hypothetical protein Cph01nite_05250 [Cellulomonas phragmiteti]
MGWFSRKAATMDEALPFLTVDDAAHLRGIAADAFRRAGCEVVVHDDHLAATDGRDFGLWNLAATCHGSGGRAAWPAVVARHVDQVLNPPPGPDSLSPEELLDIAVLRVAAVDQLPEPVLARLGYATEVVDGLLQVLVADFPATVATLGDDDVERVGLDRLLAAGRARLLAEPVEHEVMELEGGARLEMLSGESVYVASKVLVLADVLRSLHGERSYPDGVLVAVPSRTDLLFHVPVDSGVVTALQTLAGGAAKMWSTAAGGVSPSVYWWRDGALTRVSRLDDEGRVAVEVHDELGAVLNRLAAR